MSAVMLHRCSSVAAACAFSQLSMVTCLLQATFAALRSTYDFLTPDLWQETRFGKQPLQEFTDFLQKPVIGEAPKIPAY